MTAVEKRTCCGRVWGGYSHYTCGKGAKFEREGLWFCGTHDPVRIKEKNDAKSAAWDARWNARQAAQKTADAARKLQEHKAARFDELLDMLHICRDWLQGSHKGAARIQAIDSAINKAKEQS